MMRGRSTCWHSRSSASNAAYPAAVIGILSIALEPPKAAESKLLSRSGIGPAARQKLCLYRTAAPADPTLIVRPGREIGLQRAHFEVTLEISLDALRCGDSP